MTTIEHAQRLWARGRDVPGLARVRQSRHVEGVAKKFRHSLHVRERGRFILREALPAAPVGCYHLAGSNSVVSLRHSGPDAWVLHEVFGRDCYAPPPPVAERLDALGGEGGPLIVDIGGHIGLFALRMLDRFRAASVVSYEPEPSNLAMLRSTLRNNRLYDRWEVVPAAAATADGTLAFTAGLGERGHVAEAGTDGTVTVDAVDILPRLAGADLLKIDIEGGEWPILTDPRFADVAPPAIALEYHADGCPAPSPRAEAIRILEGLGYTLELGPDEHPEVGTLWAWR